MLRILMCMMSMLLTMGIFGDDAHYDCGECVRWCGVTMILIQIVVCRFDVSVPASSVCNRQCYTPPFDLGMIRWVYVIYLCCVALVCMLLLWCVCYHHAYIWTNVACCWDVGTAFHLSPYLHIY